MALDILVFVLDPVDQLSKFLKRALTVAATVESPNPLPNYASRCDARLLNPVVSIASLTL